MKAPTDQELEISVSKMLRFGVVLSALVVFAGAAMRLHTHAAVADYSRYVEGGTGLRSIAGIGQGVLHLDAEAIIQFGLLLLIATPVARVVFCVIGFGRQRDRLYLIVSSVVLVILLCSLVRGAS